MTITSTDQQPRQPSWTAPYDIPNDVIKQWYPIIQSEGFKRILSRKRTHRGLSIFPNIKSDDRVALGFKASLGDKLTGALVPTIDSTGVAGPNAIAGDFLSLRIVAGYGMEPLSTPPVSNRLIREQLKLSSTFVSDRHRNIYNQLIKVMHERPLPAKVPIRKIANTGAPDYITDIVKKKTDLVNALQNLDKFLSYVDQNDAAGLYNDFNAVIAHTIFERGQPDRVTKSNGTYSTKAREVNDEEAARSGLRAGKRFAADRSVRIDGQLINDHFAYRRRTVFGMSFVPNYVVAAHYASFREHYLNEYAFTWKHRTPATILEKMTKYKYLAGFDVTQFDQSVPAWLIDHYLDQMTNYLDKRLVKLIGLMFKAPYILPNPYITRNVKTNPFFGNPFDFDTFRHDLGLPSGIANNPDFGKLQMTWAYLCIIDDYYGDVIESGIDRILRGEHSKYALLNMSDDCIILMEDEKFHQHISKGLFKSPYYAVEPESPITFLGNVPYRDDFGALQLAPNLVSFFVNWWVPEVGIEHNSRAGFWAIGDRERRKHYSSAPSYPAAFEIYEREFHQSFGVYPTSIPAAHYAEQRKASFMTHTDTLVMQRPELLLYRIDESEVSPTVLDAIQSSLSSDDVWQYTRRSLKP